MAFMQKQTERFSAWQVETTTGTELVPADLVGEETGKDCRGLEDYLEGGQLERAVLVKGWFARLSAPGYMDCTDWSGPFKSEKEAMDYLCELYDAEDAD
jgi:hypothetical protein